MAPQKRSLDALIADLRKWAASGQVSVSDLSPEMLDQAQVVMNAGTWCIVCVGESAGQILRLYPDFADEGLAQQLTLANAARNRLVHGYYDLDSEQIWKTLNHSFTTLIDALDACERAKFA